ncbi:MAG: AAA family ATPase [Deltaproteobacteria bacterium]|nr:AAA family ATPase [Deltaproteobacteria bacterium]MCW5805268.1 AAA family ATPase [Deltaproteobacteria bacterium]
MKLTRLELDRFTAFEHAVFEFESGVNILIGENGTGKSHVLKLIYSLSEAIRRHETKEGLEGAARRSTLEDVLADTLMGVFQPDAIGRLVRRGVGRRKAKIRAVWSAGKKQRVLDVVITSLGRLTLSLSNPPELERAIYLPTREVLSIFPGFISSYLKRESSFDRTFYDLCLALDAKPLRGSRDEIRSKLLAPIERELGGRVVNENGRFYLKLADGAMEAPLVAEGIRKLGMLDYLIVNGSLTENGFLLWDEPEASLNPRLTKLTGHVVLGLADTGVQSFIATHDYILTSELSLSAEQQNSSDTAFFALVRLPDTEGTTIEKGSRLAELEHNSILKAMSDLHLREEQVFLDGTT